MITDNYIKMCEASEEIQKLREYKMGDWFYTTIYRRDKHKGFYVIDVDYGDNYPNGLLPDKHKKDNFVTKGGGIWLPTQEQLQEMMPKSDVTFLVEYIKNVELRYHDRFNEDAVGYFTGTFTSFNELWLAFVMEEKYNKVWTGEEWKKEDK